MADETFSENLLRAAVAQLHLLNGMMAAREDAERIWGTSAG